MFNVVHGQFKNVQSVQGINIATEYSEFYISVECSVDRNVEMSRCLDVQTFRCLDVQLSSYLGI